MTLVTRVFTPRSSASFVFRLKNARRRCRELAELIPKRHHTKTFLAYFRRFFSETQSWNIYLSLNLRKDREALVVTTRGICVFTHPHRNLLLYNSDILSNFSWIYIYVVPGEHLLHAGTVQFYHVISILSTSKSRWGIVYRSIVFTSESCNNRNQMYFFFFFFEM